MTEQTLPSDILHGNQTLVGIYKHVNIISHFADSLSPDMMDLCNVELRMNAQQKIAIVFYGSAGPSSLIETLLKANVSSNFTFGGGAILVNASIGYASMSSSRGCPVATIIPNQPEKSLPCYIALLDPQQFIAVAFRESGPGLARVPGPKGLYRRAMIVFKDPRNSNLEIQAITFVLNERHSSYTSPVTSSEVRKRSRITRATIHPYNIYTQLIDAQRREVKDYYAKNISDPTPIIAKYIK
jgi:hypothetical protein